MTIEETAIVNAVIPVLFIFTPPLAGFLADKIGNFRLLLCFLTGSGGLVSLLLLLIPTGTARNEPSRILKFYNHGIGPIYLLLVEISYNHSLSYLRIF